MDELELLKRDWKKREKELPHYNTSELYPMLLKKSSSIVKWIFIISIIEFVLSTILNFYLADDEYWKMIDNIHLKNFTVVSYIIGYIITFSFIYFFYKNYKRINTADSIAGLMTNILKTRKVVRYYILYILITSGAVMLLYFIFMIKYSPKLEGVLPDELSMAQWLGILAVYFVITLVFVAVLWGVYTLLYGILLRKLKRNYKELQKLEV